MRCRTCDGCGQIANTEDREPWSLWDELTGAARLAVDIGLVVPLVCPACLGTGEALPEIIENDPDIARVKPHPSLPFGQPSQKARAELIGVRRLLTSAVQLHRVHRTWASSGIGTVDAMTCYQCCSYALIVLETDDARRAEMDVTG